MTNQETRLMISIRTLTLLVAALFCSTFLGCKTHVPMIENHPGSYQKKVQAVQHWETMAKEVAAALSTEPAFHHESIHLVPTHQSAFYEAYFKLLKSQLAAADWMVVVENPQAASLHLSIVPQFIAHGRRAFASSALSPWGAVGYSTRHLVTGDIIGTEAGTRKELLVNTYVHDDKSILRFGMSQIVYIDKADTALYIEPLEPRGPFVLRATHQK